MHGGKSPGAPKGEANGNYPHGGRTKQAIAARLLAMISRGSKLLWTNHADCDDASTESNV